MGPKFENIYHAKNIARLRKGGERLFWILDKIMEEVIDNFRKCNMSGLIVLSR